MATPAKNTVSLYVLGLFLLKHHQSIFPGRSCSNTTNPYLLATPAQTASVHVLATPAQNRPSAWFGHPCSNISVNISWPPLLKHRQSISIGHPCSNTTSPYILATHAQTASVHVLVTPAQSPSVHMSWPPLLKHRPSTLPPEKLTPRFTPTQIAGASFLGRRV